MQTRHSHIPELQSLRGIAAVVVLLHHSFFLFMTGATFHYWAEVLLNAHAAVVLFFVLSGYVLARALSGIDITFENLVKFYVARIFRIYPSVWLACGLAALCVLLILQPFPTHCVSSWYISNFPSLSLKGLAKSFCCAGNSLVPPMWSVKAELLASLFIPFLVLAVRRELGLWILLCFVAILLVSTRFDLVFLPTFVLGILALRYQGRFGHYVATLPRLLFSIVVLLFFRKINPAWRFEVDYHAAVPLLMESVASAALIVGLVERTCRPLRSGVATRLGDISYSVYLLHFTVMSSIATLIGMFPFNGNVRAVILMVVTLVITLPFAAFCYKSIELSGILVGKKCYAALRSRSRLSAR